MKFKPSTTSNELIELCKKLKVKLNFIGFKNLLPKKLKKGAYIINLHNSTDKQGANTINHWVCFYTDLPKQSLYYFDSFGYNPFEEIFDYNKNVYHTNYDYQALNSGYCGEYCCYFLYLCHRQDGLKAYEIMNNEFKKLNT